MKAFLNILTICWLFIASSFPTFAQKIRITVFLGEERAEYAFIKLNNDYLGVCDAKGEYLADADAIKTGDVLKAEFAGFLSNTVTCQEGKRNYSLIISNKELQTSNVSDREIQRSLRYRQR